VSTTAATVINAGYAIAIGLLAVAILRVSRRRRPPQEQVVAEARARTGLTDGHDVGPDALRLLQHLDAHLDAHVAADPELAAGFDRLRQAIREEQNKGEL